MATTLHWKKGIFSEKHEIFRSGQNIGSLKNSIWGNSATAQLNEHSIKLESKGLWKQETHILDESGEQLGVINYNSWHTKGEIGYKGKTYSWKFNNGWNTRWSIFEGEEKLIRYKSSSTTGNIDTEIMDEGLILAGLYIQNYYTHISLIAIIIAFIPIWFTIFNQ